MNIFTMPLRHIRVKWLRTLLLAAVFTFGLASMSALHQVSGLIADNMERKLISFGANILITPRQETLKISYGGYTLGDMLVEDRPLLLDAVRQAIDAMPLRANIALVAPKMLAMTHLGGQAVPLVGVDWGEELQLKGYWEACGDFPASNSEAEALAGAAAARKLGLEPGMVLDLGGRAVFLSGTLQPTGSDDDMALFVHLSLAQDLAGKPGQASFLEVAALCAGCPIGDIVEQLQAALPESEVRALSQVAESRMYAVHFAQTLAFSVSLVILITACAMLIMSMLSAVAERRREIGIMRAVGFSKGGVFSVFVFEAVLIGCLAGVMGYILGRLLVVYVLGQLRLEGEFAPAFEGLPFLFTALVAALAAGLAAAFPAWRASLVEPAEALTSL